MSNSNRLDLLQQKLSIRNTAKLHGFIWMLMLDSIFPERAFLEVGVGFLFLFIFDKIFEPLPTLTEEEKTKLKSELSEAISEGKKIKAINIYIQIYGYNLWEAKKYIDSQTKPK